MHLTAPAITTYSATSESTSTKTHEVQTKLKEYVTEIHKVVLEQPVDAYGNAVRATSGASAIALSLIGGSTALVAGLIGVLAL